MRQDMLNRLEASLRDIDLLLETDERFEPHEVNRLTALSRAFIATVSAWKVRQDASERLKWSGQWTLQG